MSKVKLDRNKQVIQNKQNTENGVNNLLEFYPVGDSSSNVIPLMPGPNSTIDDSYGKGGTLATTAGNSSRFQ